LIEGWYGTMTFFNGTERFSVAIDPPSLTFIDRIKSLERKKSFWV